MHLLNGGKSNASLAGKLRELLDVSLRVGVARVVGSDHHLLLLFGEPLHVRNDALSHLDEVRQNVVLQRIPHGLVQDGTTFHELRYLPLNAVEHVRDGVILLHECVDHGSVASSLSEEREHSHTRHGRLRQVEGRLHARTESRNTIGIRTILHIIEVDADFTGCSTEGHRQRVAVDPLILSPGQGELVDPPTLRIGLAVLLDERLVAFAFGQCLQLGILPLSLLDGVAEVGNLHHHCSDGGDHRLLSLVGLQQRLGGSTCSRVPHELVDTEPMRQIVALEAKLRVRRILRDLVVETEPLGNDVPLHLGLQLVGGSAHTCAVNNRVGCTLGRVTKEDRLRVLAEHPRESQQDFCLLDLDVAHFALLQDLVPVSLQQRDSRTGNAFVQILGSILLHNPLELLSPRRVGLTQERAALLDVGRRDRSQPEQNLGVERAVGLAVDFEGEVVLKWGLAVMVEQPAHREDGIQLTR